MNRPARPVILAGWALATALGGCDFVRVGGRAQPARQVAVPPPLETLLPHAIRIHEFTGTRVFNEAGGISGIDVRIQAIDGFGDANKAFGQFRFELYRFDAAGPDHKGARMGVWVEDLTDPKKNRLHWNGITRTYQFKLAWDEAIPIGQKFVLTAVFQSPFSQRRFDTREFVSGQ